MSLPVAANTPLPGDRIELLIELGFATPVRVAFPDIYADSPSGGSDRLHEGLLTAVGGVTFTEGDGSPFGFGPSVQFTLRHEGTRWWQWFNTEVRGTPVTVTRWIPATSTVLARWEGAISQFEADLGEIRVTALAFDPGAFDQPFAATRVTAQDWPHAAEPIPPTGGLGSILARGRGIGHRVPLRQVRVPTEAAPSRVYEYAIHGTADILEARAASDVAPYIAGQDFVVSHRGPSVDGLPTTLVKFLTLLPPPQLTATLAATWDIDDDDLLVLPWQSFADTVGGGWLVAGTKSPFEANELSTGNLVGGPLGLGLGGLSFPSTRGIQYGELTDPDGDLRVQSFSLEFPIRRDFAPAAGPVVVGSGAEHTGSGTTLAWYLSLSGTTLSLNVWFVGAGAYATTVAVTLPAVGTWATVAFTRDGATGDFVAYVDGVAVDTATNATAIDYGGTWGLLFGAWHGPVAAAYVSDVTLGRVRFAARAWAATEVAANYYRAQRNPAQVIADVLTARGFTVNAASLAAARTALAAVDGGPLRVDRWAVDETVSVRQVVAECLAPRSMRLERLAGDEIGFVVPSIPSEAIATLGTADADGIDNALLVRRGRNSTAEAIRELVVLYRPLRGDTGTDAGFAGALAPQAVVAAGRAREELTFPAIFDHKTADVVRDWYAKRLRRFDEQIELEADGEGRGLAVGKVVRLKIPGLGSTGGYDPARYDPARYDTEGATRDLYEVRPVTWGATGRTGIIASPWDEGQFAYDARTIPTDPGINTTARLDLGASPRIVLDAFKGTPGGGGGGNADPAAPWSLTARLELATVSQLVPRDATPDDVRGTAINLGTPVGAGSLAAALAVPIDSSYVSVTVAADVSDWHLFDFAVPPSLVGTVRSVILRTRARIATGGPLSLAATLRIATFPRGILVWRQLTTALVAALSGSFADYSIDLTAEARDGILPPLEPWRVSEFVAGIPDNEQPGDLRLWVAPDISATPGDIMEVSFLALDVATDQPAPAHLGGVKWYVLGPYTGTPPLPPVDGVTTPVKTTVSLSLDHILADGTFQVWADVFDDLGRRAALVGPLVVDTATQPEV